MTITQTLRKYVVLMMIVLSALLLAGCFRSNTSQDDVVDVIVDDTNDAAEDDAAEDDAAEDDAAEDDAAEDDAAEDDAAEDDAAEDDAEDMQANVIIDITGVNFAYSLDTIEVTEGDIVTINFESTEGFHDWVIDEFNAATEKVNPGTPTSVTFVADMAGEFEYYCSVGQHRANGMFGTLIVLPAAELEAEVEVVGGVEIE